MPHSTTTGATPNPAKHDLVFTRIFDAPIQHVWEAWTAPDMVMRWWGPAGFTSPSAKMDVRAGSQSLVCMRAPKHLGGQDIYSIWHYRVVEPLVRIEYIHNLADQHGRKLDPAALGMPPDFPTDQLHAVVFKPLGADKTELTITEYGWTPGHMMNLSRMGMEQCLDKMAAALA